MPGKKPVFVRQLDAARQAQIAVVCEILAELGFIVPDAVDIDPAMLAECVIRGVDVNGVITDIAEAHTEEPAAPGSSEFDSPACPKCGSPMALRTVKNGPRSGSQFLGCIQYPECRGTRSIES